MSIFDLPYEEYIKAREKIMRDESAAEKVKHALMSSGKKYAPPWNDGQTFVLEGYLTIESTKAWWQSVWTQQYEMQGG